jgi:1-acyl-sn-glycerol-3-phosphate acyltransferase
MIRALLIALFFILAIILVLPWLILWTLVIGNPDTMYWTAMSAVRFANVLAGMHVRIEGIANIPAGACVFVANHASNVDPMAVVPAIPRRVSILVKREMFRVPIFATAMRLAQFVPVDRFGGEGAASVDAALPLLKQGASFLIFAEGTRSPDGRLRPFKLGAVRMAIEAKVPLVPMSVVGTHRIMRKKERKLYPGEVCIRFGPAVDAAEYTMDRRADLLAKIESLVAAGLPPDQQPLPRKSVSE